MLQGLFSLALPNRVGYQCRAHYQKTRQQDGGAAVEHNKPSAAVVAACQCRLAPLVQQLLATPAAQRWAQRCGFDGNASYRGWWSQLDACC